MDAEMLQKELDKQFQFAVKDYAQYLHNTLRKEARGKLSLRGKWFESSIQYQKVKKPKKAKSKSIAYEVGILDRVTFTELLTEGGKRRPPKKYLFVPNYGALKLKKNSFIPKSKRPNYLLQRKNIFIFRPEGKVPYVAKVYKRNGVQQLLVLYWLKKETSYKSGKNASFPFPTLANEFFKKHDFGEHILKILNK